MALPLLTAAAPSLIAGAASLFGGMNQRSWEAAQAQKQMDFQERMSNTAYQRAVHDMRLAGINPALAYNQGGATTPSGTMASTSDIISPAVSSAMGAMRLKKELDVMEAQRQEALASASQSRQQALYTGVKATNEARGEGDESYPVLLNAANLGLIREQINATRANAAQSWAELPGIRMRGSQFGTAMDMFMRAAFGAAGAIPGIGVGRALFPPSGGITINR